MSVAKIRKVKLKVLEVQEPVNRGGCPVEVALAMGPEAYPGANYHIGEMFYYDPKKEKERRIDMVQGVFTKGQEKQKGLIPVQISLQGGNVFNQKNPVSVVPTTTPTPEQQTLHCVQVDKVEGGVLTLSFIEPAQGEQIAYPTVYFITEKGIIDPGLSAKRRPD